MQRLPFGWTALLASALLIPAGCSGAAKSHNNSGTPSTMNIQEVSHGFGLLLPHQAFKLGAGGNPTAEIVPLRTIADMQANLSLTNPILPTTQWPLNAVLPNGDQGNHYLYAQFNSPLDRDTFLNGAPSAATSSQFSGTITVQATDPVTQQTSSVRGRVFIGGFTFGGVASGSPATLEWQQWVAADTNGKPTALVVDGGHARYGLPWHTEHWHLPRRGQAVEPEHDGVRSRLRRQPRHARDLPGRSADQHQHHQWCRLDHRQDLGELGSGRLDGWPRRDRTRSRSVAAAFLGAEHHPG